MNIRSISKLRPVLIILAFALWMLWDLTQAHDASRVVYRSFADARNVTVKSPVATSVAIVRSNDPSLANSCPVTDEGITYATIFQMVRHAVDLAVDSQGSSEAEIRC